MFITDIMVMTSWWSSQLVLGILLQQWPKVSCGGLAMQNRLTIQILTSGGSSGWIGTILLDGSGLFLCLCLARVAGKDILFSNSLSVHPLSNVWIRYFENKWTDFDAHCTSGSQGRDTKRLTLGVKGRGHTCWSWSQNPFRWYMWITIRWILTKSLR